MSDIDLPDGPKTPRGVRRIVILAVIFACLLILGEFFDNLFLGWIGEFGLGNLLKIGSIVGIILILYARRGQIVSLLD